MRTLWWLTYLGLSLSIQLSYNRMADDLATKGKRVLISLLNSLNDLGQMPKNVFLYYLTGKYHQCYYMALKFGDLQNVNL